MLIDFSRQLLAHGAQLVYAATREIGKTLDELKTEFPRVVFETAANEKLAYELALAGAYTGKRTACLFSARALYQALDPLMSSAYTGVKGGCLILCYKEDEEDISPISIFAKMPLITSDGIEDFVSLLPFAYDMSEQYQIPFLIETLVKGKAPAAAPSGDLPFQTTSHFDRNPARWAATPRFRFRLHELLNEKIERIRQDFESFPGNSSLLRGRSGTITQKVAGYAGKANESLLRLGTVFPLPLKTVKTFVASLDSFSIAEGSYPVIEMQIGDRSKLEGASLSALPPPVKGNRKGSKERPGSLRGFRVVTDLLGPGSAINIAHGMSAIPGETPLLAVTDEDAFFHSGLPAFVNSLYNGSAYILLIKVRQRREEIEKFLTGLRFSDFFSIENTGDLEHYRTAKMPAVLLFRGEM